MTDNNNIAEIKQRVNIFDVCRMASIQVNPAGGFILSIYHQEKTPSLKIYPGGQRYWDFSFFDGGDVIDFYRVLHNLDKGTAIKELMAIAGIGEGSNGVDNVARAHSAPADRPPIDDKGDLTQCLSETELGLYNGWLADQGADAALKRIRKYRYDLNEHVFQEFGRYCDGNKNDKAYKYLVDERKLTPESIERAFIFTIKNYSQVNNHLKKEFDLERLQKSGLYNRKCKSCKKPLQLKGACLCGSKEVDGNLIFYTHRIIIPYIYKFSDVAYLRGRFFSEDGRWKMDEGERAFKYLGLKDDLLRVNTSRRFYGLDVLKKMFPGERLFIVEGEFDSIMMNSSTIGFNCIAIPGAGNIPPRERFDALKDFDIHVIPDQDAAGEKFVESLAVIFNEMGKAVTVHQLPGRAKDVTDFVINEIKTSNKNIL